MNHLDLAANNEKKTALVIDEKDNVAVALADLSKGDLCTVRKEDGVEKLEILENIPFGHKVALQSIEKYESVFKYGEEIGKMKGCERFSPYELADGISVTQKMLETVVIQKEGDSLAAIQKGVKYAK